METDIIEKYNALAKDYNLPDYDSLDFEFEIYSLEDAKYLLRAILEKMAQKIYDAVKILEDALYPDASSYSSIYETRMMCEADKDNILHLHKEMMILFRKSLCIAIDHEDQEIAKFICEGFGKWQRLKQGFKEIADKLKQAWESETFKDESIKYMG
ncbi:MAG: hypothetical protein U9R34_00225 [Nanoarchaeota archaeon]|nr:hypothetical protein [Nanoarchaeota archaeon]